MLAKTTKVHRVARPVLPPVAQATCGAGRTQQVASRPKPKPKAKPRRPRATFTDGPADLSAPVGTRPAAPVFRTRRPKPGRSQDTTVVRLSNGKTYRVPSHRAEKFIAHMEGKARTTQRSLCRNQWSIWPAREG